MSRKIEPNYRNTHLGKDLSLEEKEEKLLLVEYAPLRDEVNRTIDRLNQNEAICAAFAFSLVIASQNLSGNPRILPDVMWAPSAILAVLVCFYGQQRSKVFRRHLDMVERYLTDLERRFSPNVGWSNFYDRATRDTELPRQKGTRIIFWSILHAATISNCFLTSYIHLWHYWG